MARLARRRALGALRNRHPLLGFWVQLGLSAVLLALWFRTASSSGATPFVIGVCLGMAFLQLERAGFKQLLAEAQDQDDRPGVTTGWRSEDPDHRST
jgi:hypothetical protein